MDIWRRRRQLGFVTQNAWLGSLQKNWRRRGYYKNAIVATRFPPHNTSLCWSPWTSTNWPDICMNYLSVKSHLRNHPPATVWVGMRRLLVLCWKDVDVVLVSWFGPVDAHWEHFILVFIRCFTNVNELGTNAMYIISILCSNTVSILYSLFCTFFIIVGVLCDR